MGTKLGAYSGNFDGNLARGRDIDPNYVDGKSGKQKDPPMGDGFSVSQRRYSGTGKRWPSVRDKVHEGYYTDDGDPESWKKSPLADDELVEGALKSGDFPQTKSTDYAGGRSAKRVGVPRDNKASQ